MKYAVFKHNAPDGIYIGSYDNPKRYGLIVHEGHGKIVVEVMTRLGKFADFRVVPSDAVRVFETEQEATAFETKWFAATVTAESASRLAAKKADAARDAAWEAA